MHNYLHSQNSLQAPQGFGACRNVYHIAAEGWYSCTTLKLPACNMNDAKHERCNVNSDSGSSTVVVSVLLYMPHGIRSLGTLTWHRSSNPCTVLHCTVLTAVPEAFACHVCLLGDVATAATVDKNVDKHPLSVEDLLLAYYGFATFIALFSVHSRRLCICVLSFVFTILCFRVLLNALL